jgi:hypothetical protein
MKKFFCLHLLYFSLALNKWVKWYGASCIATRVKMRKLKQLLHYETRCQIFSSSSSSSTFFHLDRSPLSSQWE